MKSLAWFAWAGFALVGVAGCSAQVTGPGSTGGFLGEGGGDDGVLCFAPTEKIPVDVSVCVDGPASFDTSDFTGILQGAFTRTDGGFVVSSAGETAETIEVTGVSPSVPDGTLVRLTYGCFVGFYGDNGRTVLLENRPEIDGVANPTESGTRLWYFASGGGEARLVDGFPFTLDSEEVCQSGTFEDGFRSPFAVLLSGPGFDARIEPGETESFTVPDGEHAGAYSLHNVNMTFIGYPGGDAASDFNIEIRRDD